MRKPERLVVSAKQEKEMAEDFGGRTTPQSGAGWAIKNDVRTDKLLIECKTVVGKTQISLKAADLENVMGNALKTGRVGILTFRLNGRDYVVSDKDDWIEQFTAASAGEEER